MTMVFCNDTILTYCAGTISCREHVFVDPERIWADPVYLGSDIYSPLERYILRFLPLMDTGVYVIRDIQGRTWNMLNGVFTTDADYGALFQFDNQLRLLFANN